MRLKGGKTRERYESVADWIDGESEALQRVGSQRSFIFVVREDDNSGPRFPIQAYTGLSHGTLDLGAVSHHEYAAAQRKDAEPIQDGSGRPGVESTRVHQCVQGFPPLTKIVANLDMHAERAHGGSVAP